MNAVAFEAGQQVQLLFGFYPFSNHSHSERTGHTDQTKHDFLIIVMRLHVLNELSIDLEGINGIAYQEGDDWAATTAYGFLRVRSATIAGGTSEIQRNIIGENVLGLPREPSTDRDLPWSQVPRS